MRKQVKCHNDVTIIGRISDEIKFDKIQNHDAIRITLDVPNDEDYNLKPNKVIAYAIDYSKEMFNGKIGRAFAFNGHLIFDKEPKVIIDVWNFLNTVN